MKILRSKKAIITLGCSMIAAAALAGTALSGLISQTIIRDSTNVHLRVVRSIADALGGHCVSLRRTEIGPFSVDEADEARIVPLDEAFGRLAAAS